MRVLVAIPMHNYAAGVIRCLRWFAHQQEFLDDYHWGRILVLDDRSSPEEVSRVRETCRGIRGADVVHLHTGLRGSLKFAGRTAEAESMDAVLVCESDALPQVGALESMLAVYRAPPASWIQPADEHFPKWRVEGSVEGGAQGPCRVVKHGSDPPETWWEGWPKAVASVSPVYEWRGQICYPTQRAWFEVQEDGNCYQILKLRDHGRVALTQAVPFLFSIWQPPALASITDAMPMLYQLDKALGLQLWSDGYIHLRLLDRIVEHQDGGRKSTA